MTVLDSALFAAGFVVEAAILILASSISVFTKTFLYFAHM